MADERVLRAQRFINDTYGGVPGITKVEETGVVDWPTVYALVRALQYELGITALSDNFGPTTLATLTAKWPSIDASSATPANVVRIVQAALCCKGYDGGDIDGTYSVRVAASVRQLKADAGLDGPYPGDAVVPKLFKALLNRDAYIRQEGGSDTVRAAQRWMNGTYVGRANFFVIACDGRYSRDVQRALMYAVQYEIGMTDDVANGVFGPGTQNGVRSATLSIGSTGAWVRLFSAAMAFNQRPGVTFTDTFDARLAGRVATFQEFVRLPLTCKGDFATWASLLVSTGDTSRRGSAADCSTEVTAARAETLAAAGYRVVGRYLSNVPGTTLDKMIKPGELRTMAARGLRCFPIYQTNGAAASYFTAAQGASDAADALYWARYHGFRPGTRIYFAVDYDAVDDEVTTNVLPYFTALKAAIDADGAGYLTGIYGARAVCARVGAEGLTSASFVSDMSSAYTGNVASPLPEDWAFDQIATIDVGTGEGAIQIDNNIASGRDLGQIAYAPPAVATDLDVRFDISRQAVALTDVRHYLRSWGLPERGAGDPTPTSTQVTAGADSTAGAFDVLISYDAVLTDLARTLRMRKALIAVSLLWTVRTGAALSPKTVVAARNYCVQQRILRGPLLDAGDPADLRAVARKMRDDDKFRINSTAYALIKTAHDLGLPRPGLADTAESTRRLLGDFLGSGGLDGSTQLGLYQVLEKHYAPLRGTGR
ncbi:glycoside hydrolase domain-containing protein [Streptomyces griseus]|uniref:glycoside hydrolase domain-containing protein n=1 Tax=Streptomyces griseus TaxID=1911 RepID=UPI00056C479B|nr:glycoside hydrolase domain-containing protein [Streptomyces griseus]